MRKALETRKLLIASVGVATLSYVSGVACERPPTAGNLPAPREPDASTSTSTSTKSVLDGPAVDGSLDSIVTSGNLMPPDPDAGLGRLGKKPQPARPCGMSPSDWCASPPGDPCGVHKNVAACRADKRCKGMPYRGESLVACRDDGSGFSPNCPSVGCISR